MLALIRNETLKLIRRRRFMIVVGIMMVILSLVSYSQYRELRAAGMSATAARQERLHAEAEARLDGVRAEIDAINDQIRASTEDLGVDLPDLPDLPEAIEKGGLPPLISSDMPWAEQTRRLIARKRYARD